MERKCPSCGHWNQDQDFCEKCNTPISPQEVEKVREVKRQEKRAFRKPNKVDVWLDSMKHSKNPFVKGVYYVVGGIWFVVMSIAAFALYLVAGTPG